MSRDVNEVTFPGTQKHAAVEKQYKRLLARFFQASIMQAPQPPKQTKQNTFQLFFKGNFYLCFSHYKINI